MLALQRSMGNRAVAGLFRTPEATDEHLPTGHKRATFFVTIKGKKQGAFKGSGTGGAIEGLSYHLGASSSRDAASGQATGRRIHGQLTFKKPFDAASPQLFDALNTNEQLDTVVLEFISTSPKGERSTAQTITLTGAAVSAWNQDSDDDANVETVSLVYESITMDNTAGKTSATDTWKAPTK